MTVAEASPVECAIEDGVALLRLNNPPLNLVTLELTRRLSGLLDELRDNDAVRVLILTGTGDRAFCAGSDIKEFPALIEKGTLLETKLAFENATFSKLAEFPKATIAALGGLAYGGGLEMAACCDFIVAEEQAMLALPEIMLGTFPGSGGTTRVTRRVGPGRAKRLMYLGEPVSSETALDWGLVDYRVAKGEAVSFARELAGKLANRPRLGIEQCKKAIDTSYDVTTAESIEAILEMSDRAFKTDEVREGVAAFFAKKKPAF